MQIRHSILWFVIVVIMLIALIIWYGKKKPTQAVTTSGETNVQSTVTANNSTAISAAVHTNTSITQSAASKPVSVPPIEDEEKQMRQELSELNDVDIKFYGRLEDQFENAVGNAEIKFEIPFNDGHNVGVHRGTMMADENGFFTISGYKGKSLDVVPIKSGYALASLNGGGIYSYLWPDSQRVHPDSNNRVIIKMWKLQGAKPLVSIDKEYKIPYTDKPIYFDLIAGQIVPDGGDIQITVSRPPGEVSEHNSQDWGFTIKAVDGGLIETDSRQPEITYAAPEEGYQQSYSLLASSNRHGIGYIQQGFFVKSRNGQVYSKLGLSFRINNMPGGLMYVRFGGVANTNSSRNWEGDPNTLKAAGQ